MPIYKAINDFSAKTVKALVQRGIVITDYHLLTDPHGTVVGQEYEITYPNGNVDLMTFAEVQHLANDIISYPELERD